MINLLGKWGRVVGNKFKCIYEKIYFLPSSSILMGQILPKSCVLRWLRIVLPSHLPYRISVFRRRMFANAHNKIISLHRNTEIKFIRNICIIGQVCVFMVYIPGKTSISGNDPIALIYKPIRPQRQWRLNHSRDQTIPLTVMMSLFDVPVFHRWHRDFDK